VGAAGQEISSHAEDAWPMKIYRMCDQAFRIDKIFPKKAFRIDKIFPKKEVA